MFDNRPPRTYTTGAVTKTLRILGIMLVACTVITLLVNYPKMPTTVPTHFNIRGEADAFGSKSCVLWLALTMAITQTLLAWVSTKPRIMNYPARITEQNAQSLYREGERLLVWVGLCVGVLHASNGLAFVSTAGGRVVAAAGTGLIVVTIIGIIRLVRASGHVAETTSPNHR